MKLEEHPLHFLKASGIIAAPVRAGIYIWMIYCHYINSSIVPPSCSEWIFGRFHVFTENQRYDVQGAESAFPLGRRNVCALGLVPSSISNVQSGVPLGWPRPHDFRCTRSHPSLLIFTLHIPVLGAHHILILFLFKIAGVSLARSVSLPTIQAQKGLVFHLPS